MSQPIEVKILKPINPINKKYPLFSIMRNEYYFLPHFLNHYRNLGITQFLIYVDNCDEEFVSLLRSQDDVAIISSTAKFGDVLVAPKGQKSRFANVVKHAIPEKIFPSQWVLTVDADEFLVLPPNIEAIPEYIEAVSKNSQLFAFAPMIDFYPKKLSLRNYTESESPFGGNPYFDSGPYTLIDIHTGQLKTISYGVRGRLLNLLAKQYPQELYQIYGTREISPPIMFKHPLIKTGEGTVRYKTHFVNRKPTLQLQSAIAHFKFHPGTDEMISTALREEQYFGGSRQYKFLDLAIKKFGDIELVCQNTIAYAGKQSLNGVWDYSS